MPLGPRKVFQGGNSFLFIYKYPVMCIPGSGASGTAAKSFLKMKTVILASFPQVSFPVHLSFIPGYLPLPNHTLNITLLPFPNVP